MSICRVNMLVHAMNTLKKYRRPIAIRHVAVAVLTLGCLLLQCPILSYAADNAIQPTKTATPDQFKFLTTVPNQFRFLTRVAAVNGGQNSARPDTGPPCGSFIYDCQSKCAGTISNNTCTDTGGSITCTLSGSSGENCVDDLRGECAPSGGTSTFTNPSGDGVTWVCVRNP